MYLTTRFSPSQGSPAVAEGASVTAVSSWPGDLPASPEDGDYVSYGDCLYRYNETAGIWVNTLIPSGSTFTEHYSFEGTEDPATEAAGDANLTINTSNGGTVDDDGAGFWEFDGVDAANEVANFTYAVPGNTTATKFYFQGVCQVLALPSAGNRNSRSIIIRNGNKPVQVCLMEGTTTSVADKKVVFTQGTGSREAGEVVADENVYDAAGLVEIITWGELTTNSHLAILVVNGVIQHIMDDPASGTDANKDWIVGDTTGTSTGHMKVQQAWLGEWS